MKARRYICAKCHVEFESKRGSYYLWRTKQTGTECLKCGAALSVVAPEKVELEFVGFWEKQASSINAYSLFSCGLSFLTISWLPKDNRSLVLYVFFGIAWTSLIMSGWWKEKAIKNAKKRQGIDDLHVYQTKILEPPEND